MSTKSRSRWLKAITCGSLLALAGCPASQQAPPRDPSNPDAPSAPSLTTFSKSYGGPREDAAHVVRGTSDGGILLVGHAGANSNDAGSLFGGDLWVSKLDANGNVELERAIGELEPSSTDNAVFTRVRATSDGGYVAILGPGLTIARYSATGSVMWSNNYSSGPWQNYDYRFGAAADIGRDLWPLPDGGFWVVADSSATLRDVNDLGFEAPNNQSELFANARSVFVMRLDANGAVTQRRRLTEDAFGLYEAAEDYDLPIIRSTADNGALIARRKTFRRSSGGAERYTLIQRLRADATVQWTRRLDDLLVPADLAQSDDAVDDTAAFPFPVRDGSADDGFIFAGNDLQGCARLVKLDASGEITWANAYDCPDLGIDDPDRSELWSILQRCQGTPALCSFLVAGVRRAEGEPLGRGTIRSVFADDGTNSALFVMTDAAVEGIDRIVHSGSSYTLLTRESRVRNGRTVPIAQLTRLRESDLQVLSTAEIQASVASDEEREAVLEIRADGGALVVPAAADSFVDIAPSGSVQRQVLLAREGTRTDRGLAAVELAAGRFIVAGESSSFSEMAEGVRKHEAWLAAFDLSATSATVSWQRRLAPGATGQITALARSNDGEILAAGSIDGQFRAVKLDSSGALLWQSDPLEVRRPWLFEPAVREIHATPEGGSVALVGHGRFSADATLVRLDAAGQILWRRTVALQNAGSLQLTDDDGDGARDDGYILAGGGQITESFASVVKLDAEGQLMWANTYAPASFNRFMGRTLGWPRIRQLPDGGFIIASTELGILTTLESDGSQEPLGQSNVLLLKINRTGSAQWLRVYGAFLDEQMNDMDVTAQGAILIAGTSQSFGDLQEGWLLKLGADALIGPSGCNAFLGSLREEEVESLDVPSASFDLTFEVESLPVVTADTVAAPARTPADFVTARQCLGSANPPTTAPAPVQFRLTIRQAGELTGVVMSTPTGIACGTGLRDQFCSAAFAAGTRVTLRADATGFRRWDVPCEEGTGGTGLACVITVDRDRSIPVVFGPPLPPPTAATLTVVVSGLDGAAVASSPAGINCTTAAAADCSESYPIGTQVLLSATPGSALRGFVGCDSVQDLSFCAVTLEADRQVAVEFGQ